MLDCLRNGDYHFPSPPPALGRQDKPGFTMALRSLPPGSNLLPEWIHSPIPIEEQDCFTMIRDGEPPLCGKVTEDMDGDVWPHRQRHKIRLEYHFPRGLGRWLPRK